MLIGMKRLTLLLPPDIYRRLEKMAAAQDRDPTQQARVIIRQALSIRAMQEHEEPGQ